MLRNKTQEFKQRYSSSVSIKQTPRDKTPEYIKNNFAKTGFTDVTTQNSIKMSRSKKVAKVQSTAFFKSRIKFQPLTQPKKFNTLQFTQNQTSMCKYFEQGKTKIENKALKSQKIDKKPSEAVLIQKCNILIKQLANIDDFFMSLTPRSLFFCCKCFRYVFAIQKNLHYPKCQNQVNLMQLSMMERQKIGWQKLNVIMQLSEYTKHKHERIKSLFKQVKNGEVRIFDEIVMSDNVTYLRFEQILEAFIYTYEMLIKDGGYENRSSIFSFKKIFSCVQLKPESSGVYEKKFFG